MIEIGIAGPGSKRAIEIEEQESPSLAHDLVASYIKETLMHSQIALDDISDVSGQYVDLADALISLRQTEVSRLKANLPMFIHLLAKQVAISTTAVTTWQSNMLAKPVTIPLTGDNEIHDRVFAIRMLPPPLALSNPFDSISEVLTRAQDNTFVLRRFARFTDRRSGLDISNIRYRIPADGEILDVQWLDDGRCAVLLKQLEWYFLLCCDLRSQDHSPADEWITVLHVFGDSTGKNDCFEPERLLLGKRPAHRVCVVLGRDASRSSRWMIYDLETESSLLKTSNDEEMEL